MISTSSSINKANLAKAKAFSSTVQNGLLSNLVSEWLFDDSLAWGEDTWENNNGTVYGTTPQAELNCVFGKCLSYNGTSDYISIPDTPGFNFGTQMSAFVWVKGNAQAKQIFTQWNSGTETQRGFDIEARSNGKVRMILSTAGTLNTKEYETNNIVLDNTWRFMGFTFSASTFRVYVDGIEPPLTKVADGAMTTIYDSTSNIAIGCSFSTNSPTLFFGGLIDDVRIYNAALSSSQIKENYIAGLDSLLSNGSISKKEYDAKISALAYEK